MSKTIVKLGNHAFITKLAGFEHSKYIQHNATPFENDIPLIQGKNIRDGKVEYQFDWYISKQISDLLPRSVLDKKCIVIPYVGSKLGELAVFENDFRCHLASNVAKLELIDEEIDLKYLFYYLKSPYGQLQLFKDKQGSAQPNITMGAIRDTSVIIYDKIDQQKIAAVLSALDDKIELNNRINAELERMAKTLYDYWFVQFDFPDANGKPYKSSGGKMVYNEVLKREIPEEWEVRKFEGLLDFTRGISYTSSTMNDSEGIPMINLKSFNLNGTYRIDGLKYYTGKLNTNRIICKDDLLIAITDVTREAEIIGRAILTPDFESDAVCSCDVARVDILNKSFTKNYLRYLFNSTHYHNYIKYFASGTLVLHLDLSGVLWYIDAIPPIELQIKFENFVKSIDHKIALSQKQNQKLSQLRDWLLPMLMNGQVKVGEVEKEYNLDKKQPQMAAEPKTDYKKKATVPLGQSDPRFNLWRDRKGMAARGSIDTATLKAIFDAMDDEDK